jgi:hypothetical protein
MLAPDQYANDFHRGIRDGKNENTYKLAWARAILEVAASYKGAEEARTITLDELSERIFGYYWDHTIYFDLYQGQNPQRQPEIVQLVRSAIEDYYQHEGVRRPVSFLRVKGRIKGFKEYGKKISTILKKDVSHRFLNVGSEKLGLYKLDLTKGLVHFPANSLYALNLYRSFLLDAVCFKWAQCCEKWNRSPRISTKVQIILPECEPRRGNLAKFLEYLTLENEKLKCFYTAAIVAPHLVSLDHVIPWSFMYSDDLWNLVITSHIKRH